MEIPSQLTRPLEPLQPVKGDSISDLMRVQLHNTQQCGVCYVRYKNLVDAVNDRQTSK